MPICGIVAEYNPFHRGHAWHLSETRRLLGAESTLICVMSGPFVQRGEPAVYNKWARAEAAVRCGADLVFELPLPWAMAPAERFARGAIALLQAGGAEALSFGSECGDLSRLRETAALLRSDAMDASIRAGLEAGLSYAEARQRSAEALAGRPLPELRRGNDLLALEYCKAIDAAGLDWRLLAVKRRGSVHDSPEEGEYPSAAYLRKLLKDGADVEQSLPPEAAAVFRSSEPVLPGALDAAILSRLRAMTPEQLSRASEVGEGLEHRLAAAVEQPTLERAVEAAATKRYPNARLRRCLTAAALGLTKEDAAGTPPYLRVLAANARGRERLAALRDSCPLPVVTKSAAARAFTGRAERCFALNASAEDLRCLGCRETEARRGGADWRTPPAMIGTVKTEQTDG